MCVKMLRTIVLCCLLALSLTAGVVQAENDGQDLVDNEPVQETACEELDWEDVTFALMDGNVEFQDARPGTLQILPHLSGRSDL